MARFTFDRSFFIPAGAVKFADKQSDAVAYAFEQAGRPCVKVFFGKQAKPVGYHSFKTAAAREAAVVRYFEGRRATVAAKAGYKADRLVKNTLVVGDILSASWGYEQTNVDFYEVTEVAGQHVIIRKIGADSQDTGWAQGRCVPQSGVFVGEPMRKLVQYGNQVKVRHTTASKWNTSTVAGVPVGPALHFSSYH